MRVQFHSLAKQLHFVMEKAGPAGEIARRGKCNVMSAVSAESAKDISIQLLLAELQLLKPRPLSTNGRR